MNNQTKKCKDEVPNIIFWNKVIEFTGCKSSLALKTVISEAYKTCDTHFKVKNIHEVAILAIFNYKDNIDKMNYGENIHEGIISNYNFNVDEIKSFMKSNNKEDIQDIKVRRVCNAVKKLLDIYFNKSTNKILSSDMKALVPVVTTYNGYVISIGRLALFNTKRDKNRTIKSAAP